MSEPASGENPVSGPSNPIVARQRFLGLNLTTLGAGGAVLLVIGLLVFEPNFYRPANLHVVMQQFAVLGLVTLGQLLVLLVGGIDLSVGAVMNASFIVIALMNQHRDQLFLSIVACLRLALDEAPSSRWTR